MQKKFMVVVLENIILLWEHVLGKNTSAILHFTEELRDLLEEIKEN